MLLYFKALISGQRGPNASPFERRRSRVASVLARSGSLFEALEDRRLLTGFPNWSSIGPAIALVPSGAGQLANTSVVNFGTTVYTGPLNVSNTLNRIRADNGPDRSHDGAVYTNPQGSGLPVDGTYYEFTVEPANGTDRNFSSSISFPGPMRILLATGGDVFFTGDHYSTFQAVYLAGAGSPTIGSFSASPSTITAGGSSTLTAANVTEAGGTIGGVNFYRESDGVSGLQVGTDTLIGAGARSGTSWSIDASASGLAAGTYTYYAVATDSAGASSPVASTTLTVNSSSSSTPITGTVLAWDVNGQSNFGTQGLLAGTVATGAANSTGLTRGTGVMTNGTAAGNAWGGSNWASSSSAGIAGGEYVTFGFTVSTGYSASLASIALNYRHSGTGPTSGYWQYQVNGGSWNLVGDFTNEFSSSSSSGAAITPISLTGIAGLQGLASGSVVNLRVVPYGASSNGGTWYIYDGGHNTNDLVINAASTLGQAAVRPTKAVVDRIAGGYLAFLDDEQWFNGLKKPAHPTMGR